MFLGPVAWQVPPDSRTPMSLDAFTETGLMASSCQIHVAKVITPVHAWLGRTMNKGCIRKMEIKAGESRCVAGRGGIDF